MENNKVGVPQSVEAPTLDEIMMAFVRIGRDGSVPVDVRNFATEWRDKIENLAEARPVEAPTVRDALKECYVDLAAVLYATTYELAPGVRAQLEKTRKLAEDALAGVGPVEAPLNKWISVEERLPEKAGEYLVERWRRGSLYRRFLLRLRAHSQAEMANRAEFRPRLRGARII